MHPFWDQCVKLMPKNIAPNTITLLGFLHSILQLVLLSIYDPDFQESKNEGVIPRWVWFVCGFAQFMAHTLDGIDGKQARRLKKGSPLGELFDHGVDAWTCSLILMSVFSAIGVSENSDTQLNPIDMFITLWVLQASFFLSHLEKFVTGTLYLPWAYDASMVGLAIFYVVCGAIGTSFLHNSVVILGIRIFVYVSMPVLAGPVAWKIWKAKTSEDEAVRNKRSWTEIWLGLQPLISAIGISFAWFYLAKDQPKIYRLMCVMCGSLFANTTCRLIISQMSSQKPRHEHYFSKLQIFAVIGLVAQIMINEEFWFFNKGDTFYNWLALTVIIVLGHLIYCTDVIVNLSRHLNIYPFSVADRIDPEESENMV